VYRDNFYPSYGKREAEPLTVGQVAAGVPYVNPGVRVGPNNSNYLVFK